MTFSDFIPPIFVRAKTTPHTEVRYVVPTRHEQTVAKRREAYLGASIRGQLAVYNATTTHEQRRRETEAFFAAARQGRAQ